jgi:hypothetical protein
MLDVYGRRCSRTGFVVVSELLVRVLVLGAIRARILGIVVVVVLGVLSCDFCIVLALMLLSKLPGGLASCGDAHLLAGRSVVRRRIDANLGHRTTRRSRGDG